MTRGRRVAALAVIFAVALAARVPGIFWGDDYPGGFRGHHLDEWKNVSNAEMLIDPKRPPRQAGAIDACMKGMAAHVAVPVIVGHAIRGRDFGAESEDSIRPPVRSLILWGRAVSAIYGALTPLVLYALARRLTGSDGTALLAAALLALGGLHVSQSHFFLSDVPAIFWALAATHLLLVDLDEQGGRPLALPGAAFCNGVAAGLKVFVLGIPSLVLAALWLPPRWSRLLHAAVLMLTGAIVVNVASMTAVDLERIRNFGLTLGVDWPLRSVARIHAVELLPSLGAPVVALAAMGLGAVLASAVRGDFSPRRIAAVCAVVVLPAALHVVVTLTSLTGVRLDPYPRHLLPLFPIACILAAVATAHVAAWLARRGLRATWIVVPLLLWQVALVADTEARYLTETRHEIVPWLRANAPPGASVSWPGHDEAIAAAGFRPVRYVDDGRPDLVVATMAEINLFLSGPGTRDSHPRDPRSISPLVTRQRVDAWQDLFAGRAGYEEVARFSEGYLMPEPRLADALVGNRERNFLTELVIFKRKDA